MAELIKLEHDETAQEFSDDEIIFFYQHCKRKDWIRTGWLEGIGNVTAYILHPVAIMNYLQGHIIFRQQSHEVNQPNAKYYPVFFSGTPTHFALGSDGKIIWDSWIPSAESRGLNKAIKNPYRWLR